MSQSPRDSRRSFLRGAGKAGLAGAAAVAATAFVGRRASAEEGRSCEDLERKLEAGYRLGQRKDGVSRAAKDAARDVHTSLRELVDTPTRANLEKAAQLAETAANNIQAYVDWNQDGLACFIMVHDEGADARVR